MMNSRLMFLMIALLLSLCLACASRPTELIQQTETARQEAKDAFADQFAVEDWSAAEKAWGQAEDALQKEDYGGANTHLLRAKSRYAKAKELALGAKEETVKKIDIQKMGANKRLETLLEANAKLTGAKRKELDDAAQGIKDKLAKVDELVKDGSFNEALLSAQRIFREVYDLEQLFKK